jgi:hypothetical protein
MRTRYSDGREVSQIIIKRGHAAYRDCRAEYDHPAFLDWPDGPSVTILQPSVLGKHGVSPSNVRDK